MDLPTLVLAASICILSSILTVLGCNRHVQSAAAHALEQVRSALPEAEKLLRDLHTERSRAAGTLRKARKQTEPDDDDLMRALQHPFAKGLLRAVKVDPDRLLAGDMEEFQKLKGLATQKQQTVSNLL